MPSQPFSKFFVLFVLFLFGGGLVITMPSKSSGQSQPAAPTSSLLFIENVGQFAAEARFQVNGNGGTIWLTDEAIWITLMEGGTRGNLPSQGRGPELKGTQEVAEPRQGVHIKLTFPGANNRPYLEPFDGRDTQISYYMGNDPAGWHSDVPVWGGVRYRELYPGVDLEISGLDGRLAPRFVCRVNCPAALDEITLEIEGAEGIEVVEGQLRLVTAVGELTFPLFQVEGSELSPNVVGNRVVAPFASRVERLQVVPADEPADLLYSTFLGGSDYEYLADLAVDDSGVAYVTGTSLSVDFPTTAGSFVENGNETFMFLTKLNSTGSDILYSAFLGGNGYDVGNSIALDGSGAVYIGGMTGSTNFPTTFSAFDRTYNGGSEDGFVSKIESNGTILTYSTYLGGNDSDNDISIDIDASSMVYVGGHTTSVNFPITSGSPPYNGSNDTFVTKINSSGTALIFSTLLGGSEFDVMWDLVVDNDGAAYVTGVTFSLDFPILPNAFDQTPDPAGDGFISKFASNGTLSYSTFFGGSSLDEGLDIAVDSSGAMYVAGATSSLDFPVTAEAFDPNFNGVSDAFVLKVNETGTDIVNGTFLGGSSNDWGANVEIAADDTLYVMGSTASANFPTTINAFDTVQNGWNDLFIARLDGEVSTLLYSTFLGGNGNGVYGGETGWGLAVEAANSVYIVGSTASANFPVTEGAFDTQLDGEWDGFIAKLTTAGNSTVTPTPTNTFTPSATSTSTSTPTPTETPTGLATATVTSSPTAGTPDITPTATESSGATFTPSPSFTPPSTVSVTPTNTQTPAASGTPTLTPSATNTVPAVPAYWLYLPAMITSP